DDAVLNAQQLPRPSDADSRERRRHEEDRAFLQRRHELASEALPRNPAQYDDERRPDDDRTAVAQYRRHDRSIAPDQDSIDRIRPLTEKASPHEQRHRHRYHGHRQEARGSHRQRLGESQRAEESTLLTDEREYRQKRHGDDEE